MNIPRRSHPRSSLSFRVPTLPGELARGIASLLVVKKSPFRSIVLAVAVALHLWLPLLSVSYRPLSLRSPLSFLRTDCRQLIWDLY